MTRIRYQLEPRGPWKDAEIDRDPFDVCNAVRARLFPNVPLPEQDPKFDRMMAARPKSPAPQAPCKARSDSPEVRGATLPASTPAARLDLANPPGKSTDGKHRLPAQPAVAGVRDTSMAAYRTLEWSGRLTKQQQVLVEFLAANAQRDYTRQELSNATGLAINAICGRVHELVDLLVLEEVGRRECRITHESANALRIRGYVSTRMAA